MSCPERPLSLSSVCSVSVVIGSTQVQFLYRSKCRCSPHFGCCTCSCLTWKGDAYDESSPSCIVLHFDFPVTASPAYRHLSTVVLLSTHFSSTLCVLVTHFSPWLLQHDVSQPWLWIRHKTLHPQCHRVLAARPQTGSDKSTRCLNHVLHYQSFSLMMK